MTDEQIALAKRAVACKGWRWMPGMRTLEVLQAPPWTLPLWDEAIVLSTYEGDPVRVCTVLGKVRELHPGAVPDLTDAATLGCLLALVREVRKAPAGSVCLHHVTVCPDPDFDVWSWYDSELPRMVVMDGSSEAEALVAALEAAL